MKRQLLSAFLLMIVLPLMADERSEAEMMAIARQQWGIQAKALGRQAATPLSRVYEDAAVVVYSPEDENGFVIVGRDTRMRPVLGVAEGRFDVQNMPCSMKAWLQDINHSLAEADQATNLQTPLQARRVQPIEPMVHTKWGQNEPFNLKTPKTITGAETPSGCVAVAMTQIMNYHQWPASADFQGRYYLLDSDWNWVAYTENIKTTYAWPYAISYGPYLPDGYKDEEKDVLVGEEDPQKQELVATLMRDCGYAISMAYRGYENGGSVAGLPNVAAAYITSFKYALLPIRYLEAPYFSAEEWFSIIYKELASGNPVLYGADDLNPENQQSHAFVIHGIGEDGLFDVNWGWTGYFDGRYALDALHNRNGNYDDNHSMIIGIHKQEQPSDRFNSLMTADSYKFIYDPTDKESKLKAVLTGFRSRSIHSYDGRAYMVIEDLAGGEPFYGDLFREDFRFNYLTGWDEDLTTFPEKLPLENNHSYRIYVASHANAESSYQPVRTKMQGGPICYKLFIDADGNGTITGPEIMKDHLLTAVQSIKKEAKTDDGVTRVYDLQGRLIYTAPTDQFNLWNVPARGILVIKQGDNVRKVAR